MTTKDMFESLGWSHNPFGMIGFPTKELNEKFNKIAIEFCRKFSSARVMRYDGRINPPSEFCDELDILIGECLAWLKTTYSDEIKHGFPAMRRLGMHTEVDPFMPQACYLAYGKCICTCGCDKIENASNFESWITRNSCWKFEMGNGYESTRFAEQVRKINALNTAFHRCEHVIRPKFLAKTKELEKAKRIAEEKEAKNKEREKLYQMHIAEKEAEYNNKRAYALSKELQEECIIKLINSLKMQYFPERKVDLHYRPAEWLPTFDTKIVKSIHEKYESFTTDNYEKTFASSVQDPLRRYKRIPTLKKSESLEIYNNIMKEAKRQSRDKANKLLTDWRAEELRKKLEEEERQAEMLARAILRLQRPTITPTLENHADESEDPV